MGEGRALREAAEEAIAEEAIAEAAGLASAFAQKVRPATVEARDEGERLRLRFDEGQRAEARLALPGADPRPGDRVLTLGDEAGRFYVVGRLRAPAREALEEALRASEEAEAGAPVRVHDKRGELLFEYDPVADRARLRIPQGDLEIVVPHGRLELAARQSLRLRSEGAVQLLSRARVELRAGGGEGASPTPHASLRLTPGEVRVVGATLSAVAERAELLANRVGIKARSVETTVERARTEARVIEIRAQRIVERAKDAYREIEGLAQLRAQKVRVVAEKSLQMVGDDALLKARDRMKIKGERIHLA